MLKPSKGVASLKSSPFSASHLFIFAIIFGVIGIIVWKSLAASSFGANIPAAPAFPTSLPERTVTNLTDLQAAVATGNIRVKVSGRITIPVDWRWTTPNVWVYGDPAGGAALIGGSIKINTSDIWVSNLEIYGGTYDGIKLGDGAAASRVVIADNWIHDVGDQGVLIAANGAQNIWIMRNKIEKVGLTPNPGVSADGHGVYTGGYGGVTKHIYILSNEIHPKAFGVQAYPEPDDVVISGNSIIGGDTRGGIVWYSGATNVKAVGNLIVDAPSAAFEVDSGGALASTGNRADENVCLRCNLWSIATPPGSGNISTTDQAVADAFRVRSDQWGWLSPFLLNGNDRTVANVGSSFSGTINIPTYQWTLTPNYSTPTDDLSSDYQAIWLGKNPSGTVDIDATQNQDWWFAWDFYIDPSWDSAHQGNWGRMYNFHNTSKEPNGWGWSQGPGTSANAIDYIGGNLMYHTEPGNNRDYVISANMQKGVWHSLLGHFVFGRTDGSTARPGHVQLWFDGSDTPIDTGDINTLYKFGPDSSGQYYIQKYMWLWTGFYTQNIPDGYTLKAKQAYVRYGHTLAEALADPATGGLNGPWSLSTIYNNLGSGSLGPATYSQITSRTDADFKVPPSLGGGTTTPPPTSTKPAIPTGLNATAGDKQVVLKWNANPSSDSVDYYQVYEGDQFLDLNVPANSTSYTVTKDHLGNALVNGTAYSFRISAHNSAGYGDWTSSAVSATPTAPTTAKLGDLDGSGTVDVTDLSMLLTRFGTTDPVADLDNSGKVDITDLSILLSHYGT